MSCCGNKRATQVTLKTNRPHALTPAINANPTPFVDPIRSAMRSAAPVQPAVAAMPTPPVNQASDLRLRYLARSSIQVQGLKSGRIYRFSAAEPVRGVARVDAEHLLATGHFRREG